MLRADSSKIISNSDIFLDNVRLQAKSFELNPPNTLYLNKQSNIAVKNFIGNNQPINFSENSFIKGYPISDNSTQEVPSKYNNVTLNGTVLLDARHATMSGNIVLEDSLFERNGSTNWDQLFISGTFINNGYFDLYTTFINNGTIENNGIWKSSEINFTGQGINYISSGPNSKYITFFHSDSGSIYTKSDIYLWGGIQVKRFVLKNNNSLYHYVGDSYWGDAMNFTNFIGNNNTIYSFGDFTLNSDTLTNVRFKDPANNTSSSIIKVGTKVVFNGTTVIEDSLMKDYGVYSDQLVEINGTLINKGYFNTSSVKLTGDLENYGVWDYTSGAHTEVSGNLPQKITVNNSSVFYTNLWLISDTSGSSYQWLKNGSPVSGETRETFAAGFIDSSFAGVYKCSINNGAYYSREITIVFNPLTDVSSDKKNIPNKFNLEQNYPNPFNPTTTFEFTLPAPQHVTFKVFDLTGREVATLIDSELSQGKHTLIFSAKNLASGLYFYRIKTPIFSQTRKMAVLR